MVKTNRITTILMAGCACAALSACGADDIASPGEGTIVLPAPTPSPSPTPTPTPTPGNVTAAADCPTISGADQLTNLGTISDGTNAWRNCGFPARFNSSTAIAKTAGVIYSLPGRVDVGTDQGAASTGSNVTLTIDPGVVVFAGTGSAFLAVNRGNKINAVGTAAQPIVFTSRENVTGSATDQSSGQWGGIVLLGRAKITDCDQAPNAAPGTTACQRDTEGTTGALYGGDNDADNSGRMSYVQIRYSGFVLANGKELQGLTPSGVGTGTQLDHIQVHNSSDDGIEAFGGSTHMKYLVLTGNEDDNLDTDVGFRGTAQFVISVQRANNNIGDTFTETDSNGSTTGTSFSEDALPRQYLKVANFTHIQRSNTGDDGATMMLRGGADLAMVNGIIVSPDQSCLRINSAATVRDADAALQDAGKPRYLSVVMQCNATPFKGTGGVDAATVQSIFSTDPNSSFAYTPSLTSLFINGATETARTAIDPKTIDSNFTTTNYIGAVKDSNDTWYAGWTCNSVTASFGSSSASCTAIPTT